jgi:hypothetical protein
MKRSIHQVLLMGCGEEVLRTPYVFDPISRDRLQQTDTTIIYVYSTSRVGFDPMHAVTRPSALLEECLSQDVETFF